MESIQFSFNVPLPFDFLIKLCKKSECTVHTNSFTMLLRFLSLR
jgi:hypothetical protein